MEMVRIYKIPECKMVSSGIAMWGEGKLERFDKWFSSFPRSVFPKDFLFWDGEWDVSGGFHWIYIHEEGMNVPDEFEIINFKGGLYAVVTGIDEQPNADRKEILNEFIKEKGFEIDNSRYELGNIITPPSAYKILGYNQMDYYTPIKAK